MINEDLINEVLQQIKADIENEDMTAIEELIKEIPEEKLNAFLPEK
jgi:hypothetical protein